MTHTPTHTEPHTLHWRDIHELPGPILTHYAVTPDGALYAHSPTRVIPGLLSQEPDTNSDFPVTHARARKENGSVKGDVAADGSV